MSDTPRPPDSEQTRVTQASGMSGSRQDTLPRGISVGRYIVLAELGSGGMGAVYSAYDPELERKVAIKLLHSHSLEQEPGTSGQARLLNEARTLAKLSHPNVLPVFDVGRFGDQLFLAMEYIPGRTLRDWQTDEDHAWRQILDQYLFAGHGLAAAHSAGVVHRDFKPHNVMIGDDGRVRVMDFGLSHTLHREPELAEAGGNRPSDKGSLLGTLAYMAPEQLRSETSTPLSDQFSFAVALYEGLYGKRPFSGRTAGELLADIQRELSPVPGDQHNVPGWLERILRKALNPDPAQRYPQMDVLLAALEADPAARRRRWIGGIAAGMGAATVTWLALGYQAPPDTLCKNAAQRFTGIWDEARRLKSAKSIMASGAPFAKETLRTVNRQLDQYRADWITVHTESCEATHIRGEQSEQMLDQRTICLEKRRQEAKALTDLLIEAAPGTASKAAKAASALSPVNDCSDVAALNSKIALPGNPQVRHAVSNIESALARAKALRQTGQYQQSEALARIQLPQAEATGYAPLIAHASYRLGDALDYLGNGKAASRFLEQAFSFAIEGGDDRRAAEAAAAQVWVTGHILNKPQEAAAWAGFGKAFLTRLGGDRRIEADLLSNEGTVAQDQGQYELALSRARQALELRRTFYGNSHERVAASIVNMANAKRTSGDMSGVTDLYQEASDIFARTLGTSHPTNVTVLYNLGGALSEQGHYERSYEINLKAVGLAREAHGDDHYETATAVQNLAEAEFALGRYEDSLAHYLSSVPVTEHYLGKQHPNLVAPLTGVVGNLIGLKRYEEAIPYLKRGLSLVENKEGQEYPLSIFRLSQAKIALYLQEDRKRARMLGQEALQLATAGGSRATTQKKAVEEFLYSL